MKSRGLTYLLLVVVLGIWSTVVWKIFFSKPQGTIPSLSATAIVTEPRHFTDDTLWLDYPDPFLRAIAQKQPSRGLSVSTKTVTRPTVKQDQSAAKLSCIGRIRKGGTNHYLLSFDGRVHLLSRGETAEGFTLRRLHGDSISLVRDGHTYFVKIP